MSPDPRQPADETPLMLDVDAPADADPENPANAPAPQAPSPDPYERLTAESAFSGWEAAILPHVDTTITAITDAISNAADTIRGQETRVRRVVAKELDAAVNVVSNSLVTLQQEGIYLAMGSAERKAELADPSGGLIAERLLSNVSTTADAPPLATDPAPSPPQPPAALPSPPQPASPPATVYCTWVWSGSEWTADLADESRPIDPASRPTRAGQFPGEIVVVPCATVPPPAPPTPAPTPGPVGNCEDVWAVGPDRNDPGSLAVRMPAPSWDYTKPPPPPDSYVVWPDPSGSGLYYAQPIAWALTSMPPGGQIVTGTANVPTPVRFTIVGEPCPYPSSPPQPPAPPTPVPPQPACPSPPPACPAPVVVVQCPPPSVPPTPVPPKPSPPTVPPPQPPGEPTSPPGSPQPGSPTRVQDDPNPVASLNWDQPAACGIAANVDPRAAAGLDAEKASDGAATWQQWVRPFGSGLEWVIPGITESFIKGVTASATSLTRTGELGQEQAVGNALLRALTPMLPGAAVPRPMEGLALAAKLGLVNRAETLLGAPLQYLFQSTQYLHQYLNPQYIPGQSEVNTLYINNKIDGGYWDCLTRANGNLPTLALKVMETQFQRPIASEVIQLRLREIIPDDATYVARMRDLGWVDPGHAMEALKLSSWIPGPGNLIRYMVRDAADPSAIEIGKLDTDFDAKFNGQIEKWAKAQGVDKDVFRYEWYSHWEYPSNTAVYEMVKRLRPDRDEVLEWERLNIAEAGNPDWIRANPQPPVFTIEDARRVLKVNDMAPAFVDSLLAVAYHPVTNSDARRAYMIGFRDERWLIERMKDNGYNQSDSELLTEFFKAERERSIGSQTGVLSARKVLGYYKDGVLDRFDADRYLTDIFPDPQVRANQIRKTDVERVADVLRAKKAGIRKGFVFGEYDDAECVKRLEEAGFPGTMIPAILAQLQAAKMSQKKEPRVRMICEWYTHKLITEEEYYSRVMRLGYTADDARRIVLVCAADKAAKAAREAQQQAERLRKEAKSNLADLKRQIKEAEARLKEVQSKLDKGKE